MAMIKKHRPGNHCWTDLGTTDVAGATKFYRGVFGWKVKDLPMGPGGDKYSLLRIKGKDVCALYPRAIEEKKMKAPPFWLPYISVANVDRTIKKVKAARGVLCMGPLEVMDKGRMAIIQDPTGAGFAIWQAKKHYGAKLAGVPGSVCWHDLSTADQGAAAKFYTKVFGWKHEGKFFGENAYHLFKLAGTGICGMWPVPLKSLPPSWITYWNVANCAKCVATAKRLGGKAILGLTVIPGMCSFAVLRDPQGAVFGVLESH